MQLPFTKSAREGDERPVRFGEDAFVALMRRVGTETLSADLWKQVLSQIIVATTSHAARDAAALALVDLGGRAFSDALLEAIQRPELAEHNGTLLFALNELGGSLPLAVLVQLIEQGSYEATAEALLFFEGGRITMPDQPSVAADLLNGLKVLRSSDDRTISEAAVEALSRLRTEFSSQAKRSAR